jgi:predicted outer membrane protein
VPIRVAGLALLFPQGPAAHSAKSNASRSDCCQPFDKAYFDNEVAYHKTVNNALQNTLIPSATNPELKDLLTTGLKIFQGHQQHAEQVAAKLK